MTDLEPPLPRRTESLAGRLPADPQSLANLLPRTARLADYLDSVVLDLVVGPPGLNQVVQQAPPRRGVVHFASKCERFALDNPRKPNVSTWGCGGPAPLFVSHPSNTIELVFAGGWSQLGETNG